MSRSSPISCVELCNFAFAQSLELSQCRFQFRPRVCGFEYRLTFNIQRCSECNCKSILGILKISSAFRTGRHLSVYCLQATGDVLGATIYGYCQVLSVISLEPLEKMYRLRISPTRLCNTHACPEVQHGWQSEPKKRIGYWFSARGDYLNQRNLRRDPSLRSSTSLFHFQLLYFRPGRLRLQTFFAHYSQYFTDLSLLSRIRQSLTS
ncbi:hypothetical protein F5880DRAFT_138392 [Lentinula raphanica]|nr:hypothetical protein F5880DRAFT_138392 [Lentinula raphanica]